MQGKEEGKKDLHSNMVRFIIKQFFFYIISLKIIYIPIWLDLLLVVKNPKLKKFLKFTFQYG